MILRFRHSRFDASLICILAFIGFVTPAAQSAVILDQSFVRPNATSASTIEDIYNECQTFTVGQNGILAGVNVQVTRSFGQTGNLFVDVCRTDASGAPLDSGTGLLASVAIPAQAVPTTFSTKLLPVDLSSFAVPVTIGEHLAIVLRSPTPYNGGANVYYWASTPLGSDNNPGVDLYTGGGAYIGLNGNWYQHVTGPYLFDQGFQTLVSVPLPAGWAGAALGLIPAIAVAFWSHRRRTTHPV